MSFETFLLLKITTYKGYFLWNQTLKHMVVDPCLVNWICDVGAREHQQDQLKTISLYWKTWDCSLINFLSFLKFLSFVLFNFLKEDHLFQLPFHPPAAGVLFLSNDHTTLQTLLICTDCCAHCLLFHEFLSSTETCLTFLLGNYDRSESL